jgi:hypothetical protein
VNFDTTVLLSFATLIVLNRAILIGENWYRRNAVFWSVQVMNLCGATFFAGWGVRDFQATMPIVNWMLSGLLILHIIQNNRRYTKAWRGFRRKEPNLERRQEVLDKLSDDA